jgi:glycosyltransferase involved in cell wall biosynthesis
VTALGGIRSPQKEELLKCSRALLFPITWDEPFGLVMIEAMLSGCPVVAFGAGSVPEVVEDGVTGFIVSSAEEMADVIRPGGRLESFDRQRCRERTVEQFSRDRLVKDHLGIYEKVISRKS